MKYKYEKLLYNNYQEYTDLKDAFKINISTRIRENNMDNWKYISDDAEILGPCLKMDYSSLINDELNKLTKNKKHIGVKKWQNN